MKLTKEQKEAYLQDPNRCPFCGGDVFADEFYECSPTTVGRSVQCNVCGKGWDEIFKLVDIEPL